MSKPELSKRLLALMSNHPGESYNYKQLAMRLQVKSMDVKRQISEVLRELGETIIEYQMVFNYKEQSHGYDVEDKKIKEEQIEVDGNKIDIIQYELSDGSEENIAQFKYEDVFYILNTTMKEEEFKKILKNLFFF